jgi:hypothetical protein
LYEASDDYPETPSDSVSILAVEEAAFPEPAEARLVDDLRNAGDLVLSLVAVVDGRVVGHAAFSKMKAPFPALASRCTPGSLVKAKRGRVLYVVRGARFRRHQRCLGGCRRTGPDNYWFGAKPQIIFDRRLPGVDAVIETSVPQLPVISIRTSIAPGPPQEAILYCLYCPRGPRTQARFAV